MALVKICGTTNIEDAVKATELGADFIGLILYPKSPRYVTDDEAREISLSLEGTNVKKVIVTVNLSYDEIRRKIDHIRPDILQLHGNIKRLEERDVEKEVEETIENPIYCIKFKGLVEEVWKAFLIDNKESLGYVPYFRNYIDRLLLDAYVEGKQGGTGKKFKWNLLKGSKLEESIVLAGGLVPSNVREAINKVSSYTKIYAVDTSSGVEDDATKDKRGRKRRKDYNKVREFIYNAKSA